MSDLPAHWSSARLEEFAEVILGQSPPGDSYNENGVGFPFFQGKAEFGDLRPTVRKWTTDPRKVALQNDVLLSVRAPVGPTNLAPCDCVVGRGLAALRPLGGINPHYLLYGIRATVDALASRATGTTFGAVSGAQVRSHVLPLAPLNEQRRIVAAIEEQFSRLEAAEGSLRQASVRVNAYTASAIAEALAGDWPTVKLGDITQEQCYGTSAKTSADPTGAAVLRMGNIQNGRLDFSELKYLPRDHPDVEKLTLQNGDLLFNRTNSPELVGKSAVFETGPQPTSFASYLIRVRLHGECDPHWAALVINSPRGREYIAQVRTQQVGQANVNGTKLAAMPIPLPPADEQRRVIANLDHHLATVSVMKSPIERAGRRSTALRRSILERAFRGELVPQDPSDEPASVLLERIAAERATAEEGTGRRPRRRATMQGS